MNPVALGGYWAAIVDVKCTWSVRRKAGRPPIPVLTMASSHQRLVEQFAQQFSLTAYKTGAFWYAHATGEKLRILLESLQQYSRFRGEQYAVWLALLRHIALHRGHRHRPLSQDILQSRERLAVRAVEVDPFKGHALK